MIHYLGSGDAVDEAHLLKATVTEGDAHLPSRVDLLIHHLHRLTSLVCLVLQVQLHVVTEVFHLVKSHSIHHHGLATVDFLLYNKFRMHLTHRQKRKMLYFITCDPFVLKPETSILPKLLKTNAIRC